MADLLTPIEARIDAILKGGRGADGSLGPDAQARAIAADSYRRSADGASLRDNAYPLAQFDRTYALEWGSQGPSEDRFNQAHSRVLVRLELSLLLGHIYGAGHASLVRTLGSEVAATAVLRPRVRSNGDVHRMRRALCFAPLYGSDTEPPISNVEQIGATVVEDLGDRLLTTVPFVVTLFASNSLAYTP